MDLVNYILQNNFESNIKLFKNAVEDSYNTLLKLKWNEENKDDSYIKGKVVDGQDEIVNIIQFIKK